jgi:hypothetical protein
MYHGRYVFPLGKIMFISPLMHKHLLFNERAFKNWPHAKTAQFTHEHVK